MIARAALEPAPGPIPARAPLAARDAGRLLVLDASRGTLADAGARDLPELLAPGDLVVVNDAATWPASLRARTAAGADVELRLTSGAFGPGATARAVLLGAGSWRTPTEHRAPPPRVEAGAWLRVERGPVLRVTAVSECSPRLVEIAIPADDAGFRALFAAGRPIQYAHVDAALAPWDVNTTYAGRPWAVEMPSAGRPLSWELFGALRACGIEVASLTHAAGLSSTGDARLDASLPWPERFEVPAATLAAVASARRRGARVIAVGTTVVRALETATQDGVTSGETALRIDAHHRLAAVDGILSGLHDPADSHFRLLECFAPREWLLAARLRAGELGYRSHELGDALLVAPRVNTRRGLPIREREATGSPAG